MGYYEEVMLMREEKAKQASRAAIRENMNRQKSISEDVEYSSIWNKLISLDEHNTDLLDFRKKVTDAFVVEGLTIFIDNCVAPHLIKEEYNQKLVRQLVSNFINEEGSNKILNKMRRTSYLMSEMAYVIDTTVQSIVEKADSKNDTSFKLDKKDKEDFYKKLEKVDVEESIDKITSRIQDETNDFINANVQEKAQLASSLEKTKKKIEDNKTKAKEKVNSKKDVEESEKIEEGYVELGKRRAVDIRENRIKNIFECMVYNLSKTAMINESANKVFVKDSRLDMEKIVEHCEVLYTFVTALDSAKLINVDEAYIKNMLNDMKK